MTDSRPPGRALPRKAVVAAAVACVAIGFGATWFALSMFWAPSAATEPLGFCPASNEIWPVVVVDGYGVVRVIGAAAEQRIEQRGCYSGGGELALGRHSCRMWRVRGRDVKELGRLDPEDCAMAIAAAGPDDR